MSDNRSDSESKSNTLELDPPTVVRGLMERLDSLDSDKLTLRQVGLIEECQGLMSAVASGRECRERRRIRECLVEIISLFASPDKRYGELDSATQKAVDDIGHVLRTLTAIGVALEPGSDRTRLLGSRTRG